MLESYAARVTKRIRTLTYVGLFLTIAGMAVLLTWVFGGAEVIERIGALWWKPMVPATAFSFFLSGLLFLSTARAPFGLSARSVFRNALIVMIFLVAGARGIELLLSSFGVTSSGMASGDMGSSGVIAPAWVWFYENHGQMSSVTVFAFIVFALAVTLAVALMRWRGARQATLAGRIAGWLLIGTGVFSVVAFAIKLPILFQDVFEDLGAIWLSPMTACGIAVLGFGLLTQTGLIRGTARSEKVIDYQVGRIYRTTASVVALITLSISVLGLNFLERKTLAQEKSNLTLTLDAKQSYLLHLLQGGYRQALLVGGDLTLLHQMRSPADLFPKGLPLTNRQELLGNVFSGNWKAEGFSGIGLVFGDRLKLLAGQMQPKSATRVAISIPGANENHKVFLIWNHGYYLSLWIPLRGDGVAKPSYLVIEQSMPEIADLIDEVSQWRHTGTLPLCGRLDTRSLVCFPQREQHAMYIVPDHIDGVPIPMFYALAGQRGVAELVDYRGQEVLAAYALVGATGLGLVLKLDMSEVYASAREAFVLLLPMLAFLILAGVGLVLLTLRPLVRKLARAYTDATEATTRFKAAMEGSLDAFIIYESQTVRRHEGLYDGRYEGQQQDLMDDAGQVADFCPVYANKIAYSLRWRTMAAGDERQGSVSSDIRWLSADQVCISRILDDPELLSLCRLVLATGQTIMDECAYPDSSGQVRHYERQVVAMPKGIALSLRDVTENKRLAEELDYTNKLQTAIVEGAAYAIISVDKDGTIRSFNPSAERMLWYTAEELVGRHALTDLCAPEAISDRAKSLSLELDRPVSPSFDALVAKVDGLSHEEREWQFVRKDGSRLPVWLSVSVLHGADNAIEGYLAIAYDRSEQKRAEEYIRHIALHDALTGLPNRVLLEDRVQVAIDLQRRNGTPFTLAMMDIDRFKQVNDSMGHHIGDQLLMAFAARIKSCLRITDTLARMGGDEFVLLLADTDAAGAEQVISRIEQALYPPIEAGVEKLHISSSIGLSVCPTDGHDQHELLRCADVAMYWVKSHGRKSHRFFERNMDQEPGERLALEGYLHRALEEQLFELYYQPKVDLNTRIVTGVEALIRLRKDDGFLSPGAFIPVAEEIGLIVPIGNWVIETACRDAALLKKQFNTALRIAVNVSARQFVHADLVPTINHALEKSGLDARYLDIEITESILMNDRSDVAAIMNELDEMGLGIAIDDFGTGYSSLSYIKRYPVSTLKIDQSFVRDLGVDPEDQALVETIIAMGRSLNMTVIAEGIETEEQRHMLAESQCHQGQGYFIARPMPLADLIQWLETDNGWHVALDSQADSGGQTPGVPTA